MTDLKCGGQCVGMGVSLGKLGQGTKTNDNVGKLSERETTNIYHYKNVYEINFQRERKA